jgi:hypothetical protein
MAYILKTKKKKKKKRGLLKYKKNTWSIKYYYLFGNSKFYRFVLKFLHISKKKKIGFGTYEKISWVLLHTSVGSLVV